MIDHILVHGYITTEDLKECYGYNHPPRAARDVREEGIPLETFKVTGSDGRRIGAYRFGDPSAMRRGRQGGRQTWPKKFKDALADRYDSRCGICSMVYAPRYLQIDHRIPFEAGGEPSGEPDLKDFMLLCGSCNRAKSWSCEHCRNWTMDHLLEVCQTCYWASPDGYAHIALELARRLDIVWKADEVPAYEPLVALAQHAQQELPAFVKDVLKATVQSGSTDSV